MSTDSASPRTPRQRHVVVVDDEDNIGRSLRLVLEHAGYRVTVCTSASEFASGRSRLLADLCLLDVRLPDGNGVELLKQLRSDGDLTPVVMISGHGTIDDALEATRAGAFDFLEKPLVRERVLLAVRNALEQATLLRDNALFRELAGSPAQLVGSSPAFRRVLEEVDRAAQSDARVLLLGESGTGKELLAARIHQRSPFRDGPFVKVNCAAIPTELIESEFFGYEKGAFTGAASLRRGKFELADRGTILLDEVGDLHPSSQAKLLRVLEEGEFQRLGGEDPIRPQVRVVASTNRDLGVLVAEGGFREDLFYRLNVVPVRVPSLRERPDDIGDLARSFLTEFCSRNNFRPRTIADDVFPLLERYRWPGNVRELRNTIERMAILTPGDVLLPDSVPIEIRTATRKGSSDLSEVRDRAERARIERALRETDWNVARAARILGIGRTNLHKRMRVLGLTRPSPG